MKIKESLTKVVNLLKKRFERFPLTMGAITLLTLFITIFIENEIISAKAWSNILCFSIYFILGALLTESIHKEKKKENIILYGIFTFAATILTILPNIESFASFGETYFRIVACYVATLMILSIYFLHKHSKNSFESYTLKIFSNLLKTTFSYGILAIGIAIIYYIFIYLILDVKVLLLERLEILLFGIYYITKVIYDFVDIEDEVSNFFKGLVKYVLSSLVFASFLIIYVYIIKILILRDMPKNQIFRILSALFIIGMPIWTMAQHYKGNDLWYKISSKLPIAFIPFVLLQIYSMGIRILNNGFTPARYCSVILILFEIIYIAMYIRKKEKIGNLLLILNALIIISVIVPVINMFSISNMSQYNRFKIYYEKNDYTDEEKLSIYNAYEYLKYSIGGEKYIDSLSKSDIEKITKFYNDSINYDYVDYDYVRASKDLNKIDLQDYSSLYLLNAASSSKDETIEDVIVEIDNTSIKIDLTDKINEYIEKNNTYTSSSYFNQYFDDNSEFDIDSDKKIIIKSITVKYDTSSLDIKSYSIVGYLLVKDL